MEEKRKVELLLGLVMLIVVSALAGNVAAVSGEGESRKYVVAIDPGHGGSDPGKVGINNALEKEINLSISYKLKEYLESSGVTVYLTREDDNGLYQETDSNKKVADLNERCRRIKEWEPDLTVSIHQNSYHEESVSGGQVFYYTTSEEGKKIAEAIQNQFSGMDESKKARPPKANGDYYMLIHVPSPIVIVECGFLSNWEEAQALVTEEYQEKVAWAVQMGVMEYLKQKN